MPHQVDEHRKASGPKAKLMDAFRRVALGGRRSSSDSVPTASSSSHAGPSTTKAPTRPTATRARSTPDDRDAPPSRRIRQSPSVDSLASTAPSSRPTSVLQPPSRKLDSSSPASELPKTWEEWNYAYQHGMIDFNDPPPPPSDLRSSEFATHTGQFRAPLPVNEARRQRAVDSVGLVKAIIEPSTAALDSNSNGASPTKRQKGPLHPALEKLAIEAKSRFGVDASTISLMDRDKQVFLADNSCRFVEDVDALPRELTCCSHAMLKASTGTKDPLVILDFAQDWRFERNGFDPYAEGFYAAAPIMLPAPMGDDEGAYPGGIFCLLGEKPKAGFSDQDRLDLQEMADRASNEIQQYSTKQREDKRAALGQRRAEWKKSKLVRRASMQVQSLDKVVEMPTPPRTPDLGQDPLDWGDDVAQDKLFAQVDEARDADPARRPSLPDSIGSSGSVSGLESTSVAPTFRSRRAGRPGIVVAPAKPLASDVKSVLDLTTQLVAESIEMDFAYVVAVDLAAAKSGAAYAGASASARPSPIRLVSTYGLEAVAAPLFSVESHLDAVVSEQHSALLYADDDAAGSVAAHREGDYSTGLLVRVGTTDDGKVGFVLGCFTEDARRVINSEDLLFVRSFARDLRKYVAALA
ncbi:hypothetical protein JCM9279_005384 [Rhodotorula babjevae]